jgi:hypothetical protein
MFMNKGGAASFAILKFVWQAEEAIDRSLREPQVEQVIHQDKLAEKGSTDSRFDFKRRRKKTNSKQSCCQTLDSIS